MNISFASVVAGIMVMVSFFHTEYLHLTNQVAAPMAPVTQTVTPSETATTDILPTSSLNPSTSGTATAASGLITPPTGVSATGLAGPAVCTDAACLITAAQSCSPASGSFTSMFDVFGIAETMQNSYSIIGPAANNTCSYTATVTSATIAPDAAFKKAAAIHKTSLANIQSDLSSAQASLNQANGTTTACAQPSAKVVQFLTGMSTGIVAAQYMNAYDPSCTVTPPPPAGGQAAATQTSASGTATATVAPMPVTTAQPQ